MCMSNKTKQTRYNFNTTALVRRTRKAQAFSFLLPVLDVDHEDDHQGPTRFVASTRGHRTGRPGHN